MNAGKCKAGARRKVARSLSSSSASGDAGEEQAAKEHELLETSHSQDETLSESGEIEDWLRIRSTGHQRMRTRQEQEKERMSYEQTA